MFKLLRKMNENQTTQAIKNTLGATYSVKEVKAFLEAAELESAAQAPYFDARLLRRIERLRKALNLA